MKLIFRAFCCAVIISCLVSLAGFYKNCEKIEDSVFRLHIIANSDSPEDQQQKLRVRDEILEYTRPIFENCSTKEESIRAAQENIDQIKQAAKKAAESCGGSYPVEAYVTNMTFDTRVYDDFTLPAGKYDALRIVLGEGKGHNWWCVLYPAVCVGSSSADISSALGEEETDIVTGSDRYTVRLKIVEWFEEIASLFG